MTIDDLIFMLNNYKDDYGNIEVCMNEDERYITSAHIEENGEYDDGTIRKVLIIKG